jgi:hypothetical protein
MLAFVLLLDGGLEAGERRGQAADRQGSNGIPNDRENGSAQATATTNDPAGRL